MPNRGVIQGVRAENTWQLFNPGVPAILRAYAQSGTPTQPALGASTVNAQYLYDRATGTVAYNGLIQFSSDATFGSSDHVWAIRLPVPAYRSLGGADLPIGTGWAWQGSAGNRNVALRATLMDPMLSDGQGGGEDYYAQFFLPYLIATGTGQLTSGNTAVTITHGLGSTPAAYDINVVPTNAASTAPGEIYVDTITSTQFNVNVRSSATTTPQAFSWKARAEPNGSATLDLLTNSTRPFAWASGYVLSWHLRYQARR